MLAKNGRRSQTAATRLGTHSVGRRGWLCRAGFQGLNLVFRALTAAATECAHLGRRRPPAKSAARRTCQKARGRPRPQKQHCA